MLCPSNTPRALCTLAATTVTPADLIPVRRESSLAFELAIWRGGQQITRGEVVYVCADPAARKSGKTVALR